MTAIDGERGEQRLDGLDPVHRAPTTWPPTTAAQASAGVVRASTGVVIQPEDCRVASVASARAESAAPLRERPGERLGVDHHRGPGGAGLAQGRQGAGVVVADRAADVDDQPALRGEGVGGVQDGAQAVLGPERDPRQGLERVGQGLVVVHAGVGARVGGEQVHGIPGVDDVGGDARRRGDAPLERAAAPGAAVADGAGVEHDDGTTLGRPVLLAHHQLAGARGRRPVDAAQVVAVAVLAHGLVVLAVQRDHVGDRALRPDAAAERAALGERHHLGQHDDLGVTAHRGGAQGQPERVAHPHAERADAVHAAGVRAHRVLHLLHVAGTQRGQHEARPVAQGVVDRLLGHDDRRRRRTRCCGCAP